jgi:hypothetical protein
VRLVELKANVFASDRTLVVAAAAKIFVFLIWHTLCNNLSKLTE